MKQITEVIGQVASRPISRCQTLRRRGRRRAVRGDGPTVE